MGLFDFFKKAEIAKINILKERIVSLESIIAANEIHIKELSEKVNALSKFQKIADAEKEAINIIEEAKKQADSIIKNAEIKSNELNAKANSIFEKAISQEQNAKQVYSNLISSAEDESSNIVSHAYSEASILRKKAFNTLNEATNQASTIIKNAQARAEEIAGDAYKAKNEATNQASTIIKNAQARAEEIAGDAYKAKNEATNQASTIIKNAQARAEEIAGDAYKAKNEAADLTKTITALRNTVKGYGDDYIIPTYSLLDELAENFGYTEAGTELKRARERTRLMIKNDLAAKCDYVEDYRRITAINFISDAFNGKVDTILSGVKQDNFGTLKQKIVDAYHLVNNLGKAFRNAVVTKEYLDSRIEELKWAVIVTELKNKEREEQRRIKEQIREEERAKREFEKAIKDAEKEEDTIKKALEKATKELEAASDEQKQKYEAKLAELNERLKVAEEKGQRALSMAQQTKSGHVYVISNIGSFGENVYKIGMTRRLEPEDRVKELGDASVPFSFDIHAMIYSEDAPTLETSLHRYFVDKQMNKVNARKEFFKVGITDIRRKVDELNLPAKWTMIAQAAEYHETIAIEKELQNSNAKREEWAKSQLLCIQSDLNTESDVDN